jgi:hypothetical protein
MFSVPFRWGSLRVGIIGIANAQDGVLCNGWLSSVQAEVEGGEGRGGEGRGGEGRYMAFVHFGPFVGWTYIF